MLNIISVGENLDSMVRLGGNPDSTLDGRSSRGSDFCRGCVVKGLECLCRRASIFVGVRNGRWQVEVTCKMEEWVLVEHESQGNQS